MQIPAEHKRWHVRGHGAQPLYSFTVQLGQLPAPSEAAKDKETAEGPEPLLLRIGLRQVSCSLQICHVLLQMPNLQGAVLTCYPKDVHGVRLQWMSLAP